MNTDQFWALIEQARANAGAAADQAVREYDEPDLDPDHDYWDFDDVDLAERMGEPSADDAAPGPGDLGLSTDEADLDDDDLDDDDLEEDDLTDAVAIALFDLLVRLPAGEIAEFDNAFEDVRAVADRRDIANAAILIEHGLLGDETFDDFRAGLVALGRRAFEAALSDPDSLAAHPLVREIAAASDPRWLGREDLLFVASHAYTEVTGEDEITFYDFAERHRSDDDLARGELETPAVAQAVPDWDITDEAQTRRVLPGLADLFYERSMRNRERALARLGLVTGEG